MNVKQLFHAEIAEKKTKFLSNNDSLRFIPRFNSNIFEIYFMTLQTKSTWFRWADAALIVLLNINPSAPVWLLALREQIFLCSFPSTYSIYEISFYYIVYVKKIKCNYYVNIWKLTSTTAVKPPAFKKSKIQSRISV